MKKFTLMLLSLLLMLVGCGGKQETKNKVSTLDFLWFSDGNEGQVMQEIAKSYEEKNPNVKINLIEVPFKDLTNKLKTMITGGKPPALARMVNPMEYKNFVLDLKGTVKPEEFYDSLAPYYIDKSGLITGFPVDITANGLIYNKTLFDKAGVKVPQNTNEIWTWDEFQVALKNVVAKSDAQYGLVWDYTHHRWSTLLYEYGGRILSEDEKSIVVDNEAGVKALKKFVELHDEKIIPTSVWLGNENPNNLFRSGVIAAHLAGSWMMNNYKDINNFEWGVTYLPIGTNRSSVSGGKYISGFKNTGVEEETKKFIAFLSTQEINRKYNLDTLSLSSRKDNAILEYSYGKEKFAVFANELGSTPAYTSKDWSNATVASMRDVFRGNIAEAVQKKITPEEALKRISEEGTEMLKKAK